MFDRIHHAGIAIKDLGIAQDVFVKGLGLLVDETRSPLPDGNLQRGPDPTDILDVPIGGMELELNAPPSDGTTPGGTHRFVQSRGGVGALHHICLHSDNVPDDVAHLRASGLTQLESPEEQEREPWREVTFFHPKDCLGILLEIWRTENHNVGDNYQGAGVFTGMHHIGIVTDDLEKARHFWCNIIGLRVDTLRSPTLKGGKFIENENVRILNIPLGKNSGEIVAVSPQDVSSGTARFLEKYGGKSHGTMHHISLETEDVKSAIDFVEGNGLKRVGRVTEEEAWIHPASAGGVLIQIVKK
ncbi:MAG: VOC family protein [Chloroflexota bacterium]|nr:VOC family protein [Chloroflexota bacterium]|tara:strand:- start:17858 stop:18757 length:900 start_codon:yes stop_codon:yes gene_type:complete